MPAARPHTAHRCASATRVRKDTCRTAPSDGTTRRNQPRARKAHRMHRPPRRYGTAVRGNPRMPARPPEQRYPRRRNRNRPSNGAQDTRPVRLPEGVGNIRQPESDPVGQLRFTPRTKRRAGDRRTAGDGQAGRTHRHDREKTHTSDSSDTARAPNLRQVRSRAAVQACGTGRAARRSDTAASIPHVVNCPPPVSFRWPYRRRGRPGWSRPHAMYSPLRPDNIPLSGRCTS